MRMVSSIVSPFVAEEDSLAFSIESTLPPSRSMALSNERRVRVEGSKKREASILPRKDSSRLLSYEVAISKTLLSASRSNCCVSIKCCIGESIPFREIATSDSPLGSRELRARGGPTVNSELSNSRGILAPMANITIKKPFDSHLHLRRGTVLRAVTPYSAERFGRAIIMPNTEPPIETVEQAAEYKKEILAALPRGSCFEPLMTFYLTKKLAPSEIERGQRGEGGTKIYAVKSYPFGATTNSQWGYRNILEAKSVLKKMEEVGMPLLLHGEVHLNERDEEEDPYDGEAVFIKDTLPRLLESHPKLRVTLEHMRSREAIDFMEKNGKEGQLVTTVTPHHLMYDRRHAFSGGYRALLHCNPLVKKREDRERLRDMVKKGLPFVSAGTDSAPHPESKKFSSCCAFGVFNAPVAVEMYTQVFDEIGALDKLESFLSVNGPRFFGFEPSTKTITLIKKDWQVTEPVITEDGIKIWPVAHKEHGLGNEMIRWQISQN